ncbi:MAG: UDP-N-acetylmuramate dehydrogenase [Coriobacteriia bacterium]|nr:UDP-N-acetylmuramate dehydrogenase [Coriobacteriia bacterium]
MKLREQVAISELTTMRLGGAARYVAEVCVPADVVEAYRFAREQDLPVYIIGGGSNVVGRDEGFGGVVLLNRLSGLRSVDETEGTIVVEAAAGELLDDLAAFTAQRGYTGLEATSAIPGAIGGAVMQNAGAYGQELSDVLVAVKAYDTQSGEFVTFERDQLELSYRHSIFNSSAQGRYFITAAVVQLHRGEIEGELYGSLQAYLDEQGIADRQPMTIRDAVSAIRAEKLPDPAEFASSGSFFKNITVREDEIENLRMRFDGIPIFLIGACWEIASGWLVEQAGLKGKLLHGMRVSDKAALILINESARSYADLAAARSEITQAVQEKFGFALCQEPEEI